MGDIIKIGDLVTRKKYNNDLIFKIIDIEDDIYYLKGVNVRLYADSYLDDLVLYDDSFDIEHEKVFLERIDSSYQFERNDYFYLPGKILHLDGDNEYLNRCLKYYEKNNVAAIGFCMKEDEIKDKIYDLLKEYKPNIVVITGHDAYYKRKGNIKDLDNYKNSYNFVLSVKAARQYESWC